MDTFDWKEGYKFASRRIPSLPDWGLATPVTDSEIIDTAWHFVSNYLPCQWWIKIKKISVRFQSVNLVTRWMMFSVTGTACFATQHKKNICKSVRVLLLNIKSETYMM